VHGAPWLARDPGGEPYTLEDCELLLPTFSGGELEIIAHVGHAHTPHLIERFRKLPVTADNPVALAYRERSRGSRPESSRSAWSSAICWS
jgi:hypothetical protein